MYYIEITLLPALEISQAFLMSKIFSAIHTRLVEMKDEKGNVGIGVSFPEYSESEKTLGKKLRLIAQNKEIIEKFEAKRLLKIYSEYAHITSIRDVPSKSATFIKFSRVQPSASPERRARRKAKYKNVSYEEVMESTPGYVPEQLTLPYILIRSRSTNKSFSVFVKKEQVHSNNEFIFNTYGLSKGGSLPEF